MHLNTSTKGKHFGRKRRKFQHFNLLHLQHLNLLHLQHINLLHLSHAQAEQHKKISSGHMPTAYSHCSCCPLHDCKCISRILVCVLKISAYVHLHQRRPDLNPSMQ